jgi:hypothetical protein
VDVSWVNVDPRAFAVQVIGVMFTLSNDPPTQNQGLKIYSIGNGIQQAFICAFALLVWRFNIVGRRGHSGDREWTGARRLLRAVWIVLALITVSHDA